MENRMTIAGFGGQGVLMIGQLISFAACLNGKNAIFLPKYGAEQRGGTAKCDVTVSDDMIYSPFVRYVDVLMALNQPSLVKHSALVKPGGLIILNSDRCTGEMSRHDVKVYRIAVDSIAEKIGSPKVANIVMLGAYLQVTGALTKDEITLAIHRKLGKKPEYMEMNMAALDAGIDAAKAQ